MSRALVFYSVTDAHGIDHLVFRGHRTLCGHPVLADDTIMGFALHYGSDDDDDAPYNPFRDVVDCEPCRAHAARLS